MKAPAATIVALLVVCGETSAHRLDEYLQATRVSIARERLTLEVDMTPGVSIAPALVETLDANADRVIAPAEANAYGSAVLSDVRVAFDGAPVAMRLTRIAIPTIDEMRNGIGTIRLEAVGSIEAGVGRHRLDLRNNHRPDASVYMVNALVPEDGGIHLVSQSRDSRQREFHLETAVSSEWPMRLLWLGVGGTALAVVVARGKNGKRRTKNG